MRFERRDAILVGGVVLLSVGMMPFVPVILSIAGGAAAFFGIKWYVERRRRSIMYDIGRGICAQCGSAVTGDRCSQCDTPESTP